MSMGLLKHLLFWPVTGPLFLAEFSLNKVQGVVREELTDDTRIKAELMELQLKLELGDIDDDEYVAMEADLMLQLREIRHWREQFGMGVSGGPVRVQAQPDRWSRTTAPTSWTRTTARAARPRMTSTRSVPAGGGSGRWRGHRPEPRLGLMPAHEPVARAAGDAPFTFVVGKGGVGKTTGAARWRSSWPTPAPTHLISTDPAHSLADLFHAIGEGGPSCIGLLTACCIEEFDAAAPPATGSSTPRPRSRRSSRAVRTWTTRTWPRSARLALPGIDEMMAVLRLVELARTHGRVVVDTAPTGHTLRLLDAAPIPTSPLRGRSGHGRQGRRRGRRHGGAGRPHAGEDIIEELDAYAAAFRDARTGQAAFVVTAAPVMWSWPRRAGWRRGCAVAAPARRRHGMPGRWQAGPGRAQRPCLEVPLLDVPQAAPGLRRWRDAARGSCAAVPHVSRTGPERQQVDRTPGSIRIRTSAGQRAPPAHDGDRPVWPPTASRLARGPAQRLLLFAGKGGVGKSTCAAAAALRCPGNAPVLLCSTDPAGSLDDVLALRRGRARALRRAADRCGGAARGACATYQEEVGGGARAMGLSGAAALDRRVIDDSVDLAPPGIDEFAALAAMLNAAGDDELVVIDSAPTGHFLRLLRCRTWRSTGPGSSCGSS
jgi:arsenite/tail-anchored protein-transporting ATPase